MNFHFRFTRGLAITASITIVTGSYACVSILDFPSAPHSQQAKCITIDDVRNLPRGDDKSATRGSCWLLVDNWIEEELICEMDTTPSEPSGPGEFLLLNSLEDEGICIVTHENQVVLFTEPEMIGDLYSGGTYALGLINGMLASKWNGSDSSNEPLVITLIEGTIEEETMIVRVSVRRIDIGNEGSVLFAGRNTDRQLTVVWVYQQAPAATGLNANMR